MIMRKIESKITNLKQIRDIARRLRLKGKVIVTTNGCFDLIHLGHVKNLQKARLLGDVLIVGINSDSSARKNKGGDKPITSHKERSRIVAALESVDYVLIFDQTDPSLWLKLIKPDIHVKGRDRKMEDIKERWAVKEGGGKVILLPLVKGVSTTKIINRIKKLKP